MKKLNEALKQEIDKEILPTGVSKTKDGYRVSYKFNGKHLSFGERKRLNDAIALNNNVKVILELARGNNKQLLEENRQLKGKVTELGREIELNEFWMRRKSVDFEDMNEAYDFLKSAYTDKERELLDAHYTIARLKKRNLWQRIFNKELD